MKKAYDKNAQVKRLLGIEGVHSLPELTKEVKKEDAKLKPFTLKKPKNIEDIPNPHTNSLGDKTLEEVAKTKDDIEDLNYNDNPGVIKRAWNHINRKSIARKRAQATAHQVGSQLGDQVGIPAPIAASAAVGVTDFVGRASEKVMKELKKDKKIKRKLKLQDYRDSKILAFKKARERRRRNSKLY